MITGKNNKIDLVIITNEPFPIGMAATNRILTYATEIAKQKKVKVLIAKPTELPQKIKNVASEGIYKNINFKYMHATTVWPKESTKIYKLYMLVMGAILLLIELHKYKPKAIIMAGISSAHNSFLLRVLVTHFSKFARVNIYQEMSEYPPILKQKTIFLYKYLYLMMYRKLDGIIVMTSELINYFTSIGQKNIFHLPMTVDIKRFSIPKKSKNSSKMLFAYCGGGNYERDGLLHIIKAFIDLYKKHANFEFHIIGPIDEGNHLYQNALDEIKKNKLQEHIKFLGAVRSDEIPNLLSKADCLIMAPPKDFDSGGFPTKLGEYLATGIPVICTKVSEISFYLDETSALLVEPANHIALVGAMSKVISDYSTYENIGKKGRLIASSKFSASAYTDALIHFLKV